MVDAFNDTNGVVLHGIDEQGDRHIVEVTTPRKVIYLVFDQAIKATEVALNTTKKLLASLDVIGASDLNVSTSRHGFIHPTTRMLVVGDNIVVKIIYPWTMSISSELSSARSRFPSIKFVIGKDITKLEHTLVNWKLCGWFSLKKTAVLISDTLKENGRHVYRHQIPSPAHTCSISKENQDPIPQSLFDSVAAVHWNHDTRRGSIATPSWHRDSMDLSSMYEIMTNHSFAIILVHDAGDAVTSKLISSTTPESLVIDTYQFSKELIVKKKDYRLASLTGMEAGARAIVRLTDTLGLVQLLFRLSLITGQPVSKASSKMGRIEWLLVRHFAELNHIPPDRLECVPSTSYQAGMVLEPRRGIHTSSVLYLDFTSLYPSLCVEYNICYSSDGHVLPPLLERLIEERKSLTEAAKTSSLAGITRTCLKLLSNAIYGCLASPYSRFYSIDLAESITRAGRNSLSNAVSTIERVFGFTVLYGDTDSVMVSVPNSTQKQKDHLNKVLADHGKPISADPLKDLASIVTSHINGSYKYLEIKLEGVIDSIILFAKKCYACMMDGKLEIKGMDMIKRGHPPCGVMASEWIIDLLFRSLDSSPSDILDEVYRYTNDTLFSLISKAADLSSFIITSQLSKDFSKYTTTSGIPHLQAIANHRNLSGQQLVVRKGDFVNYIMSIEQGPVLVNLDDPSSAFSINTKWYLNHVTGMIDRILSVFPAHRISNIFSKNITNSNYLSFLGPKRTAAAASDNLAIRTPTTLVCRICDHATSYTGFLDFERHLSSASGSHHLHVTHDSLMASIPRDMISCTNCTAEHAFESVIKDPSTPYDFFLSIDTSRVTKQSDCSRCKREARDFLNQNGFSGRFSDLLKRSRSS